MQAREYLAPLGLHLVVAEGPPGGSAALARQIVRLLLFAVPEAGVHLGLQDDLGRAVASARREEAPQQLFQHDFDSIHPLNAGEHRARRQQFEIALALPHLKTTQGLPRPHRQEAAQSQAEVLMEVVRMSFVVR